MARPTDAGGGAGAITAALLSPEERRALRRRGIMEKVTQEVAALQPYRQLTHVVLFLALLAIMGLVYTGIDRSAFSSALFPSSKFDFGAVIDAGSHGSRLYLYTWPARIQDPEHPLSGPVTVPTEVFALRAVPGISSMAEAGNDPARTGPVCIAPLVDALAAELERRGIVRDFWGGIPIFLKATAGMRNVDQDVRATVMRSIRDFLETTPFTFQRPWARITAGEEEGIYGWLAVNNASGTLFSTPEHTVGALDMGGASVQITFSPLHTSILEGYNGMKLGGHEINLYSHSFIGYGWGDAMVRLTTRLSVGKILTTLREAGFDPGTRGSASAFLRAVAAAAPAPARRLGALSNRISVAPVAAATSTTAPPTSTTPPAPTQLVRIKARHPCYPRGHRFEFELPRVQAPDRRHYIDLDLDQVLAYLRSTGAGPEELRRLVPKRRGPPATQVSPAAAAEFDDFVDRRELHEFRDLSPDDDDDDDDGDDGGDGAAVDDNGGGADTDDGDDDGADDVASVAGPQPRVQWVVEFRGSGDFQQCQSLARDLFFAEPCFMHSCSFNGVYQPRLETSKFTAFGQYAKVREALGVGQSAPLREIARKAEGVCGMTRKRLRRAVRAGRFQPYGKNGVMNLCWKSIYAHTLLTWGLGFGENSTQITFAPVPKDAGGTSAGPAEFSGGWAAGSMIAEVNGFVWKTPLGRFGVPFLFAAAATALLMLSTWILLVQVRSHSRLLGLAGLTRQRYPLSVLDDTDDDTDVAGDVAISGS